MINKNIVIINNIFQTLGRQSVSDMIFSGRTFKKCYKFNERVFARPVSYIQGQMPENKVREYFYYIDHNGMLFLDDAKMKNFTSCFKDKKFLQFFFHRLRVNDTKRYQNEFPYLSICGRERNFIRCDDLPIVYTHVLATSDEQTQMLSYGHAGDLLTFPFEPDKIYMSASSGRVYHPTETKYGSIGLIRSKLAIEFSKNFEFDNDEHELAPTHFTWNGVRYNLDQSWMTTVPTPR